MPNAPSLLRCAHRLIIGFPQQVHYRPNYYAAFVFDPDGNNIEAVCHAPEPG